MVIVSYCVNRDLRKAEEEEKWREKVNNRDKWKRIIKVAVGAYIGVTNRPASPLHRGNQRKNTTVCISNNYWIVERKWVHVCFVVDIIKNIETAYHIDE